MLDFSRTINIDYANKLIRINNNIFTIKVRYFMVVGAVV